MPLRTRVWTVGRFLVLVGALGATYFGFAAVAVRVAVRARDVVVPDVTGTTVADATARLAPVDLHLTVDPAERPSAEVPAGRVLGQEPRAGMASRRQRSVRVWLSAGPRVAYMPQLVGESERGAVIRLAQEGLDSPSIATIRSADFSVDQVIAQEPPAGRPAASVQLLVSRGADMAAYVMPDLIGLEGEAAASVLRQQGFRVSFVAEQADSGVPTGVVVRQAPAGGYQVQPGAAISLEVAR
ncbi:MAG: PASTA domain-containing protein [Vicinamibacterales bacterium]